MDYKRSPAQALPDVIRGLMARRRVSQTAPAEAIGVAQSQLSKLLRGVRPLTINQVEALAAALGTTVPNLWEEAEKEASA